MGFHTIYTHRIKLKVGFEYRRLAHTRLAPTTIRLPFVPHGLGLLLPNSYFLYFLVCVCVCVFLVFPCVCVCVCVCVCFHILNFNFKR